MVDYYDRILLAVVAILAAGVVVSVHPSIALYQGSAGGSLLTTPLLYEILFRNPPPKPTHSTTMTTVIVGMSLLLSLMLYF